MAVCTSEEIFNFIGASSDIRTDKETFINSLISDTTKEIEATIGRKLEKTEFTNVGLVDNINCLFIKNKIYLKYKYRDVYNITSLYINNEEFNNYELDKYKGLILFKNIIDPMKRINFSGYLGLVNEEEKTFLDLKSAIIEIVSVKSKFWTRNIYTLEGTVKTLVLDISDESKKTIKKYCLKEY